MRCFQIAREKTAQIMARASAAQRRQSAFATPVDAERRLMEEEEEAESFEVA